MRHAVFALTALCLIASAVGCRMCAHPYDYCGPTFTGGNCQPCDFYARAGSILSPPLQTSAAAQGQVISEETGPTEVIQEEVAPAADAKMTPPDITRRGPVVLPASPRRAATSQGATRR
jgi:hypothetical protein